MFPTSTDVAIVAKTTVPQNSDAVVVFIAEGSKTPDAGLLLSETDRGALTRVLAGGVARGKSREVGFDLVDAGKGKFRRILAVGLGKMDKVDAEAVRQAAAAAVKALCKHRLSSAALLIPILKNLEVASATEAVVVGSLLAAFDFEEYKGTARKSDPELRPPMKLQLTLVAADLNAAKGGLDRGRIIGDARTSPARLPPVPAMSSILRHWLTLPNRWPKRLGSASESWTKRR